MNPVEKAKKDIDSISPFLSQLQKMVLLEAVNPERDESRFFVDMAERLSSQIKAMPVTYQQDGMGDNAVAHLHYFYGGYDAWITEKDMEGGVMQAFGLVKISGHKPELGYISIAELVKAGVELDLYFKPTTLGEIKAELSACSQKPNGRQCPSPSM